MSKQSELIDKLETLVDESGLYGVTAALELLCYEKAEHVQINWQDKIAAKRWELAGKAFRKAFDKLESIQVGG